MNKIILILLTFCIGVTAQAQSISFFDLTNLTNLTDGQAHNYLTLSGVFKHQYLEEKDGKKIEHFRSVSPAIKEQTVTIGENTKLTNGSVLRSVFYTTRDPQHVVNMISQAKRGKLIMKFQGADANNNIYIFDNEFYRVNMYISTSESKASVEVKQKEFAGY